MNIIVRSNKLMFLVAGCYHSAPFLFSQVNRGEEIYFRFISIDQSLFNFEVEFSTILQEDASPFGSAEELRDFLMMYSGESNSYAGSANFSVIEMTANGSIPTGKKAISVIFRGNSGTLDGVPVPDGYSNSWSNDGGLNHITIGCPLDGEARVIVSILE